MAYQSFAQQGFARVLADKWELFQGNYATPSLAGAELHNREPRLETLDAEVGDSFKQLSRQVTGGTLSEVVTPGLIAEIVIPLKQDGYSKELRIYWDLK